MKTVINSKATRAGIKFVTGILSKHHILPILNNVHVCANGCFRVTATDLDVTLQARLPGQTSMEGKTTMPGRALADAVSGQLDVELDTDEKHVTTVRARSAVRSVVGIPDSAFPPIIAAPDGSPSVTVPADLFMSCLKRVSAAISKDHTRYILQSVCLEIAPDSITFVATDGRRLHKCTLALCGLPLTRNEASVSCPMRTLVIPDYTVKHILRMPLDKKTPGDITITNWDVISQPVGNAEAEKTGFVRLDAGILSITSRLLVGTFPNYRIVLPLDTKSSVSVNVADFKSAVEVASEAVSAKCNAVKLSFTNNQLIVSANTPDVGSSSMTLAVNWTSPDLCIAFDPDYLIDVCNSFKPAGGHMMLHFIDDLSPLKVTDGTNLAIVMPMRLQ